MHLFYSVTAVDEGVSPVVQQAFASMLEEKTPSTDDDDDDEEQEEEEEEEEEEEDEDTLSYVDDTNDADFSIDVKKVLEKEESARGRGGGGGRRKRKKKMKKEDGGGGGGDGGDGGDGGGGDGRESPSVGDIFALEMELNRENSKMMRVKREIILFCVYVGFLCINMCLCVHIYIYTSCVCVCVCNAYIFMHNVCVSVGAPPSQ